MSIDDVAEATSFFVGRRAQPVKLQRIVLRHTPEDRLTVAELAVLEGLTETYLPEPQPTSSPRRRVDPSPDETPRTDQPGAGQLGDHRRGPEVAARTEAASIAQAERLQAAHRRLVNAPTPRLGLTATPIDEHAIGTLSQMSFLTGLYLDRTKVTQTGINQLRAALPGCNIVYDDSPPTETSEL